MSKWLEILGFGARKERTRGAPGIARKAARIRETMRWRGFDLSPYSDEEIVAESERLGGGISETGETTEASREALAAALRERRRSPRPPEHGAADLAPSLPPSRETKDAEVVQEAAEERPVPSEQAAPPAGRRPSQRPTRAPSGPDERTPLVRFRHVFGIHSWRLAEGPDGALLRCPGCGQERPIGRGAQAAPFTFEEPGEEGTENAAVPRPDLTPPAADDGGGVPGGGSHERRREATPGLVERLLASPWWVKMLAIFATFQVIGVITSLFRS